ncbi:MAG: NAD(P)/FAD-dependent oxidoreductase [Pelagibacteraceae bacterium TMED124]|nr:MAG: NAD(P)/FAD-dependent oxidoreductase [Pelagibacteraceae bacterium TMED124]|tara:strand:- start:16756 stop:17787 length:1032 start_codon:yes stop_codon:yes gene_type:complete
MKNSNLKIAIIGAGWYGCHIASFLLDKGIEIQIFDKADSFFTGASGFNQNRLHLGFHYPRCSKTRFFSKNGFQLFKKKYPTLSNVIDKNYYCIHKTKSLLDFETYKMVMNAEKLKFKNVDNDLFFKLHNIEGIIDCEEEYIDHVKAKNYFESKLGSFFNGKCEINKNNINSYLDHYDWVIDCTWGGYKNYLPKQIYYEACIFMIYESALKEKVALTVMDGKLFSLFPFENNLYSLTSVKETPFSLHSNQQEARDACNSIMEDKEMIDKKISLFEKEINSVFPDFKKHFSFSRVETSIKTKFKSEADSRIVEYFIEDNIISIFAGKIDTVFYAENIIEKEIFNE